MSPLKKRAKTRENKRSSGLALVSLDVADELEVEAEVQGVVFLRGGGARQGQAVDLTAQAETLLHVHAAGLPRLPPLPAIGGVVDGHVGHTEDTHREQPSVTIYCKRPTGVKPLPGEDKRLTPFYTPPPPLP